MKEFDLEEWLLELELEEERTDPHYSIYYTPDHDPEEEEYA